MWNWAQKLAELERDGVAAALVTLVSSQGSAPREAGAKMVVLEDGHWFGTIGGGRLEELGKAEAQRCLADRQSRMVRVPLGAAVGQCCGGVVDLFVDVVNTGPNLYLFGAGHVGQALARVLLGTAFKIHVVDERAEWIDAPELPGEVIRHRCRWDEFVDDASFSDVTTYAAIMTHEHERDEAIVQELVKRPARYIGLIGSQPKWTRFKRRLLARGTEEEQLARVKCPIGIDTGGKAPQEVAISAAAELLKIHYGR